MHSSAESRIAAMTQAGHWSADTLHGLLAQRAADCPNHPAVIDQPNIKTLIGRSAAALDFDQLHRASTELAGQLLALGIRESDAVMVQLPNVAELVICFLAVSKLGAILSPIPIQYAEHELCSLSATLKPKAVITMERCREQRLADTARQALPHIPVWEFGCELPSLAQLLETENHSTASRTATAYAQQIGDDAHRVVTICWTSGTTGTPKGVPRSHAMWLAATRTTMEAGSYQPNERLLNPFPLVNMAAIAGFLYPSMVLGDTLVLHHPLDPELYLQQLQDERIQFTIAPPALLNRLAAQPELWRAFDFSSLRAVGSGSAPLSPDMIATFERDYHKPIVNFYGSNEGIALFATPENAGNPELRASYFERLDLVDASSNRYAQSALRTKIIDTESGAEITSPGVPGELCFAGATVFDGYLEHDNRDVFTEDGFFRTGDLVEIGGYHDRYYRIVGRCKDIINRGGMKISPSEIDALLEAHPHIAEAAVCGYPDPELNERLCACVVPAPGSHTPTLDALQRYLQDAGLARFKWPERLVVMDALPRNPMNKVLRGELVEIASKAGATSLPTMAAAFEENHASE